MEKVSFKTGNIKVAINDDETKFIEFNPSDMNLMSRIKVVEKSLKGCGEKYNSMPKDATVDYMVATLEEIEKEIRKDVNYLFNADVYDTLFQGTSPVTFVGNKMYAEIVLDSFKPIFNKYLGAEAENMGKRIGKYQKAYRR